MERVEGKLLLMYDRYLFLSLGCVSLPCSAACADRYMYFNPLVRGGMAKAQGG